MFTINNLVSVPGWRIVNPGIDENNLFRRITDPSVSVAFYTWHNDTRRSKTGGKLMFEAELTSIPGEGEDFPVGRFFSVRLDDPDVEDRWRSTLFRAMISHRTRVQRRPASPRAFAAFTRRIAGREPGQKASLSLDFLSTYYNLTISTWEYRLPTGWGGMAVTHWRGINSTFLKNFGKRIERDTVTLKIGSIFFRKEDWKHIDCPCERIYIYRIRKVRTIYYSMYYLTID